MIDAQGSGVLKGAAMSVDTVSLLVRMPAPLRQQAQTVAKLRGETVSEVVRAALRNYVQEMLDDAVVMGRNTGVFPAPEGAACLAAQKRLLANGWIKPDETVVLFNTGSGLKYSHLWA